MARRFLLLQRQDEFVINVNEKPLPESDDLERIEYSFPRDYTEEELPEGIEIDEEGWGVEEVQAGREIRWKLNFHKDTIDEEELRGVAVYAKGKLAQRPFLFNLTKGLEGQHGTEYLTGQVLADYVDELRQDLIATERQRINWNHPETKSLLEWGQRRLRQLLALWAERRGQWRRTSSRL
jgi:hypothetical protein